jgi:hypothetical protein
LVFYTGDYGERLINRLNKRRLHAEAYYGKILALNDLSPKNDVNNRSTTTTITDPGISDPSHAILIGDEVGPTTRTVTATAPANRTTNTSGVAASTGTVIPGVVFLGVETDSNADQIFIDQAKAAGLDGLLLFHVSVKTKGKSSPPYSVTVLSVHNLKKSDDVLKASSLSSETVAKTREKNRKESDDPVELQLDKIFKGFSDDKLRVSAMPELKPEIAKKRVETLSGETHGNPLPVVGEIMSYHKSGLVDEATAVAAIAKILGNQDAATKLVTGSEDEKKAAIEKWMPENFKLSDSPAGDFR